MTVDDFIQSYLLLEEKIKINNVKYETLSKERNEIAKQKKHYMIMY